MVRRLFAKFRTCDSGASAVEYGLLMALLVMALIGAVTAVGSETTGNFEATANSYPDT